ncbi:MAG: flippase [Deltaproteobacteria bacterium]|nr:flippase [Deltaproteobacteria bacterium]
MPRLRKLAHNTLIGLGGTVAHKALAFATTLVLARGLGQEGFGVYSFVGVYIFFASFLVDLGMERVVTRELSRAPKESDQIIGNAILLKLAFSAVVIPAAYVVAIVLGVPADVRWCILVAALGLPLSIDSLLRGFFQSRFEVRYIFAVTLPSSALFLALASICVSLHLPVRSVFYAQLINGMITLSVLMALTLRHLRPSLRLQPQMMKFLLRDAGEVGLFVLMFMLAMRLDQILLYQLSGAEEVGRYAIGVRVTEALSVFPEALMMTVFPLLASTQHSAPQRFHETYRLSFKYLAATVLPIALVLTLTRDEMIDVFFGAAYRSSGVPLVILAWGMFFAYTGAVYLNLFIVQSLHRLMLLVSLVALVADVAINFWLIPRYGASGAAAATVLANLVGFVFWALHPSTAGFIAVCLRETLRPLASIGGAWGMVWLLHLDGLPAAVTAVGSYLAVLAALGGVGRGDVVLIRQLFAPERAA